MINANKAFKSQNKKVNYADIILRDGTVLNLEPSDFILGGFSMTDETTTGKFGVGSAVGKTISLTIANHTNKFSMYDFYKSIIYMYVSVTLEDGTVLKERKGKYYVINPTSPGDVINISGVDSMYLFDKPYNASTAYPATLQSILSDCCLECGVNIGFRQFDNYNFTVENRPEECTYRQVVSWVAQIAGYNARISNNDYLELVWFNNNAVNILDGGKLFLNNEYDIYDGGDFSDYTDNILWDGGDFTDTSPENITRIKSISVSTDNVKITGVMVKYDDVEILEGEEGYCITVSDNDFIAGKEKEIAKYLFDRFNGFEFRPLSCQIANNPLIESFDSVYVYDRKGNIYFSFINSVSYSINGFTTIACKAEDPIRNESSYVSKEAQAVVKSRKEAKKELSNYDKAVQNMNMLAANAMGLYRESETLEDRSVIYYQSNRPIFKNESGKCEFAINSVVYKMTGDGFFVSTDGGKSYTSGFDSQGNAVLNVLAAIGIQFDWAKGGILSLGGVNNTSGVLQVKNEAGKLLITLDKNGITFEGGQKIKYSDISGTPTNISSFTNDSGFVNENTTTEIARNEIRTANIVCSQLKGGTVSLGGSTNTPANLKLYNESDELIGLWNVDGMYAKSKIVQYSSFSSIADFGATHTYGDNDIRYLRGPHSNNHNMQIIQGTMRLYLVIPDDSTSTLETVVIESKDTSSGSTNLYYSHTYTINRNSCVKCYPDLSSDLEEYYTLEQNPDAYYFDIDMMQLANDLTTSRGYISHIIISKKSEMAQIAGIRFMNRQYSDKTEGGISQYDDIFIKNSIASHAIQMQIDTFRSEIDVGNIEIKPNLIEFYPDSKIVGKKPTMYASPIEGVAYWNDAMIISTEKILHEASYGNVSSTSGAKALYIQTDGTFISSSSSKRYKENISYDVEKYHCEGLYDVNVAEFKYKDEFGGGNMELGLIAEDVAEHFPSGAIYNKDGTVESWSERAMIPALLKLIQEQNKRIKILEKSIMDL